MFRYNKFARLCMRFSDGGAQPTPETPAETPPEVTGSGDGGQEQPVSVTLTQADLDAMIDKAFAKGARKASKDKPAVEPKPTEADEITKKTNERMEMANQRMVSGAVRSFAADLGMTDNGAKAAMKLVDFADCFDESGELDDDDVKSALSGFLKAFPEFVKQKKIPPKAADDTGSAPMLKDAKAEKKRKYHGIK